MPTITTGLSLCASARKNRFCFEFNVMVTNAYTDFCKVIGVRTTDFSTVDSSETDSSESK